ncbi:hypothetical protein GCM10010306_021550 [Streptomyces umbrinus]|uniref:DUF4265 domain-containing protein n=1 Tax=Streptomyces umbrinus TaxID=67370 RepID=UPI0019A8F0A5|nr:DUF4265 domain-containing protein [Streptomyces umbrinus]GHB28854.1 hypothetical protein GCM10010306_021550 [Streptomyces umbrinus]
MTNISDDHVKVHFRMDIDEDDWPPASVESLWALDLGDGTVRLDNTPWFVRGVASGDIIRVQPDDEGVLWAGETVQPSQNCTIRLIVLKDDGSAAARQSVLEVFHRLGTTGEGIEQFRMVALDVPPQADLPKSASCWSTERRRSAGTGKKGVSPPPGKPLRELEHSGALFKPAVSPGLHRSRAGTSRFTPLKSAAALI